MYQIILCARARERASFTIVRATCFRSGNDSATVRILIDVIVR
jgi:hypothetical protein